MPSDDGHVFEHVPAGLYRTTPDGEILDVNREFVEMLRYADRQSLLRTSADRLYADPADRARWQRQLRERGLVRNMEACLRRADGSTLWVRESARAERDPDGRVLYYEGLIEDISREKEARASARRGYELYRALVEHSSDVILEVDEQRRILYASPSVRRLLGYEAAELRGRDALGFVPRKERTALRAAFERAAARPERATEGVEHRLLDSERRWRSFESRGTAVRDAHGSLRYVVTAREITERKRVEEAIHRSESRFRSIFEFAPLGIYLAGLDGSILAANARLAEILDYPNAEALLQVNLADLQRDAGRAEPCERFEPPGEAADLELRWWRKDGVAIWVQLSSHGVTGPDGQTIAFEGFVRDVTQRKLAEQGRQQLEEAHARLSLAVENAAESIVITDPEGTIVYVNPAFERITGYSRQDALGHNPRMLKSGRQDQSLYDQLWRTLRAGEVWSGRFTNKRKDGSLFEEEATISPVRDQSGRVVNYVAVKRDVTNERRLEQQLRQAQKMEAVGRLAGGVAHDFNNLLGVIIGYGELLRNRLPSGDASRSRLEQILKAAERAGGLTRQLLAFSRRQVLQPKILDLNLVVQDMERMLKRLIGEDIELVTSLQGGLSRVRADPGQVEQVIMNLAVNARDAMPEGGRLSIATRNATVSRDGPGEEALMEPGGYALLEIRDTGAGIAPEALPYIFEPFFTTKEMGKGTGLGLSTVYGIVKQSGGYVWAGSELGKGTTFRVYLPGHELPLDAGLEPAASPASRGRETLLVVEDEPMLLALLQETLEAEGYTVLTAANGDAAILTAGSHAGPIHLMLSDVVMPGTSGRALALQMSRLRPETRILFVSGYTDDAIARHGVLEPGVEFLSKPFTPQVVALRVRSVLDAPKSATPAAAAVAPG